MEAGQQGSWGLEAGQQGSWGQEGGSKVPGAGQTNKTFISETALAGLST